MNLGSSASQTNVDEDWPIAIRQPICGTVKIPHTLIERVNTIKYRRLIKANDSQMSLHNQSEMIIDDVSQRERAAKSTLQHNTKPMNFELP